MDKIGQAYGAGMAGAAAFDPVKFVKNPTVILRIVSWVFAIIVFGCISSGCWYILDGESVCVYDSNSGACGFGTAIGVLGFLACIIFLAVDAYFENISSVQLRKQVVIGDLGCSGVFTFLFFVTFCYLTNKWTSSSFDAEDYDKNPAQAAIAFSFFSIFTWAGLTFFAWRRYQQGAATAFSSSTYEQDFAAGGVPPYGYEGGPTAGGTESYQEPPFTASNDSSGPQYKQPAY